jgi:hypothetical protein
MLNRYKEIIGGTVEEAEDKDNIFWAKFYKYTEEIKKRHNIKGMLCIIRSESDQDKLSFCIEREKEDENNNNFKSKW